MSGASYWTTGDQELRDGLPVWAKAVRLRLNMDCEDPYPFELIARWSVKGRFHDASSRAPDGLMVLWGQARCRKCTKCAERRSRLWAGRALSEFRYTQQVGGRTWLGTFTLSPEKHQFFDWQLEVGDKVAQRAPIDIFRLHEAGRFSARASIIADEITLWLKRLRKGNQRPLAGGHWSPKLRYLLIAEAHDSEATSDVMRGRPHFHILLHEQKAGALVIGDVGEALRKRRSYELQHRRALERGVWIDEIWAHNDAWVKREWSHGHSSFRLCVDARSAVYPCKYLTKSMRVRVRNSQYYGQLDGEMDRSIPADWPFTRAEERELATASHHDPKTRQAEEGGQGETPRRFPPRSEASLEKSVSDFSPFGVVVD